MKLKNFLSIPIFSVFLVMGFVYYITVFILIEDWVGLQTSAGSLNSMIFTTLACLCVLSFLVGVLTDPGRVPSSYIPDVEDASFASDQEPKKNVLQSKYCDKCAAYKPPRTHHCRVCKRCILRMDHHCLWINNCVGYWNYKAFFNLILYATIGSIHSSVIVISCFRQKDWNYSGTTPLKIFYYYEGIRAAWLAKKSGLSYRHPFDISVYKNITLVLGPNTLRWFCPTSTSHLKDGVNFPTLRDTS
ncbi:probable protein S-acyltransferase 15 isoform X2 [Gossypium hirsutum]|uniref:S-acyltransferase n=1 Tax=Gossypium hirsutum TaxID=3635 RepID=A0ABM2YU38_GOSHI|nr:probable protein S-acyltransferase 15 isoform X2 [Gossypium hirsutum]